MNSLLQTLHNLNAFRRAVYHMPTSPDDEPHASIALALQSLFFKLQFGPSAVPTKDLTRSFGWDSVDAFMRDADAAGSPTKWRTPTCATRSSRSSRNTPIASCPSACSTRPGNRPTRRDTSKG